MLAVHLVTVCLLAAAWTAPEVIEEEGSYVSRFYRWFSESSKSCLLFLVALPSLMDALAQLLVWRSLLWLSMTWWWMYLTQSNNVHFQRRCANLMIYDLKLKKDVLILKIMLWFCAFGFQAMPHPSCYLTSILDKTHHGPVIALFFVQLLEFF